MKYLALFVALVVAAALAVQAGSDQEFVIVGRAAISEAIESNPDLEMPVMMEMASQGWTDAELELASPALVAEEHRIAENAAELSRVELLARQVGAPIYSEMRMNKNEEEVSRIENAIAGHPAPYVNPVSFLGSALSLVEVDENEIDSELAMIETQVQVQEDVKKQHDYAYLDDPQNGGAPTILKNLKGLDIYVVNTPVADNDNEIRPVAPPHPKSSSDRERERIAKLMRRQLVHAVPEPHAVVKPKTKINTMSAYEETLIPSPPLARNSADQRARSTDPLVGGIGGRLLMGSRNKNPVASPRFAQVFQGAEAEEGSLPGTGNMPAFPKEPAAARGLSVTGPQPIVVGIGSSFDNRDGPPKLLDDLLPLKAILVEELDPLHLAGGQAPESIPVGW